MNVLKQSNPNHVRVMWLAVILALLSAAAYVLIAWKVLAVGDMQLEQDGGVIVYIAAAGYLLGGLLILLRKNWLLAVGAVINVLVILFFFNMYQDRPAVMFSAGGIITKIPQLLLEATLLYLIASGWMKSGRQAG